MQALFSGQRVRRWVNVERSTLRKLEQLDCSAVLDDLRVPPGNHLELLKDKRKGQHSIRINDQWRVCFVWTAQGPMTHHSHTSNIAAKLDALKRKIPDLGPITDPQSFALLMRKNGYATTITQQPLPKGAAFEVIVPAKELYLLFVSAELCSTFSSR